MTFAIFLQQLINGLTLGSFYGLIAIGYTMVFGIIGMVNFAHGDLFMLSAYFALIAFVVIAVIAGIGSVAVALLVMLLLAMLFTSLWNWAIERLAYRPLRGSFRLAPLISAIGMSMVLSNFVRLVQGTESKSIPDLMPGTLVVYSDGSFNVTISYAQICIFALMVLLLVTFWYVVTRTPLGRAQRAVEQDRKMAALVGINVDRTVSLTFVMGAALAAVAGVLFMLNFKSVNPNDGFTPGIKAFTAAVLGGIGSLPGAVLGGLLIGLIETMWAQRFGSDYKDVAAFSILAITLIFMPQGLLGRPEVEKV